MGNFKHLILLPLLLTAILNPSAGAERRQTRIISASGKQVPLSIELAITPAEHQRGLMYRDVLPAEDGMLFIFHDTRFRHFWMKDTRIPLSIAYIDDNGIIFQILDMKPMNSTLIYSSRYPARYALEVNRGWFDRNGIKPGCRIILDGCLGK